jgi:hypothetical protein
MTRNIASSAVRDRNFKTEKPMDQASGFVLSPVLDDHSLMDISAS